MIEIGAALQTRLENALASAGPFWDEETRGRADDLMEALRASGGLEEAELTELMNLLRHSAEGRSPREETGPPEEKQSPGEEKTKKEGVQPPPERSCAQLINILDFLYRRQRKLREEQQRKHKIIRR